MLIITEPSNKVNDAYNKKPLLTQRQKWLSIYYIVITAYFSNNSDICG